jgi:hypothetical protein
MVSRCTGKEARWLSCEKAPVCNADSMATSLRVRIRAESRSLKQQA